MFNLSTNGVIEVVLWGTQTNIGQVRLVFQLKLLAGGPLDFDAISEDLQIWTQRVVETMVPLQASNLVWNGFSFNTLNDSDVSGFIPFPANIPGESASTALPSGVAALVYMNTGASRRQLRKYVPGLCEDDTGGSGNFNTNVATELADLATDLMGVQDLTNGDWEYGHSRPGDGASWVTPNTMTISLIPAYQRRRRTGRGS